MSRNPFKDLEEYDRRQYVNQQTNQQRNKTFSDDGLAWVIVNGFKISIIMIAIILLISFIIQLF